MELEESVKRLRFPVTEEELQEIKAALARDRKEREEKERREQEILETRQRRFAEFDASDEPDASSTVAALLHQQKDIKIKALRDEVQRLGTENARMRLRMGLLDDPLAKEFAQMRRAAISDSNWAPSEDGSVAADSSDSSSNSTDASLAHDSYSDASTSHNSPREEEQVIVPDEDAVKQDNANILLHVSVSDSPARQEPEEPMDQSDEWLTSPAKELLESPADSPAPATFTPAGPPSRSLPFYFARPQISSFSAAETPPLPLSSNSAGKSGRPVPSGAPLPSPSAARILFPGGERPVSSAAVEEIQASNRDLHSQVQDLQDETSQLRLKFAEKTAAYERELTKRQAAHEELAERFTAQAKAGEEAAQAQALQLEALSSARAQDREAFDEERAELHRQVDDLRRTTEEAAQTAVQMKEELASARAQEYAELNSTIDTKFSAVEEASAGLHRQFDGVRQTVEEVAEAQAAQAAQLKELESAHSRDHDAINQAFATAAEANTEVQRQVDALRQTAQAAEAHAAQLEDLASTRDSKFVAAEEVSSDLQRKVDAMRQAAVEAAEAHAAQLEDLTSRQAQDRDFISNTMDKKFSATEKTTVELRHEVEALREVAKEARRLAEEATNARAHVQQRVKELEQQQEAAAINAQDQAQSQAAAAIKAQDQERKVAELEATIRKLQRPSYSSNAGAYAFVAFALAVLIYYGGMAFLQSQLDLIPTFAV